MILSCICVNCYGSRIEDHPYAVEYGWPWPFLLYVYDGPAFEMWIFSGGIPGEVSFAGIVCDLLVAIAVVLTIDRTARNWTRSGIALRYSVRSLLVLMFWCAVVLSFRRLSTRWQDEWLIWIPLAPILVTGGSCAKSVLCVVANRRIRLGMRC